MGGLLSKSRNIMSTEKYHNTLLQTEQARILSSLLCDTRSSGSRYAINAIVYKCIPQEPVEVSQGGTK